MSDTNIMRTVRVFGLLSILLHVSAGVPAGETLWTGTVTLDEDFTVPAGSTLRVEAGTRVELAEAVTVRVFGRLLADGTEAAPISFTRSEPGARWGRILFLEAEDSRLSHCIVEFADCEGSHLDYYDDDCDPETELPPRDYHEAIVVIASRVDFDACIFQNLPDDGGDGEGDAIAVISDDPERPGAATASITRCRFESIGQGVHSRFSYVLVEDCFFTGHNGDNDDVDLYGESTPPPLISHNLFLDPEADDMINPTRCSAVLVANVIAGSNDHGIVLRDRCDPVLINNVIYDCSSAGIAVQNTCDALLANNTIAECGRGVRFFDHTGRWGPPYCLEPGSGKATLINCVVWDCPTTFELQDSPSESDPGSHLTLIHCDIEGDAQQDISGNSTVTFGEGNIDADPMFADAANGDFRPLAGSPLIDAGTADGAPADDLDGNARPCGDGVDIGAIEAGDCETPSAQPFLRGDVNTDGVIDISDPVRLLFGLFLDQPVTCQKSADTDDSGDLALTDAVGVLNFLFLDGPAPGAPGLACGTDPTEDPLTCGAYGACP